MLYATENKRRTVAAVLAAVLTLAIGFGIGRLTHSSTPNLKPRVADLQRQLAAKQTTTNTLAGDLNTARRNTLQLRSTVIHQHSTITRQQARIIRLQRRLHPNKR